MVLNITLMFISDSRRLKFVVQIEVNFRALWLKLELNYNISQSTGDDLINFAILYFVLVLKSF